MSIAGLQTGAAVAALALSGVSAGCGDQQKPPLPAKPKTIACDPARDDGRSLRIDLLVGLSEKVAERLSEQQGCGFRILERDGESMIGTADYRPDRVNVAVRDGKVVRAWAG